MPKTEVKPQVEWLTKKQAAARLGLGARRTLDLAQSKAIKAERFRDPESHQWTVRFQAADIDRYLEERRKKAEAEPPAQGVRAMQNGAIAVRASLASDTQQQPPSPHDWLTLAEAANATHGLPESFLLQLIHAGELPCLDVGVRPGGRYRVKRRDLEAIDGARVERAQTAGA
jgi:excisionase family DNA binding protein